AGSLHRSRAARRRIAASRRDAESRRRGATLVPELSLSAQAVFRVGYAALLLGFLLMIVPHARRFLRSERWGGYARSERFVDLVHNPVVSGVTLAVWTASAVCLALGRWTLIAALVSLLIARYFFVQMRWRGVARGMGAPGFMTYWLAAA